MDERIRPFAEKMDKSYNNMLEEFGAIRAGRANPKVLSRITVDYYGTPTPLQQVGNITVPEARILQMFLQQRDSWIIQWILLYLQERYLKDDAARLEAILMQVRYGCSSPIMYLEAMEVIRRDPYLLKRLEKAECRVLLYGVREHLLTEKTAARICSLVSAQPSYDQMQLKILEECYAVSPNQDMLFAICSMLIAGDIKDRSAFAWYSLGVDKDLRITGLYEYYMETMDLVGIEKMP